MFITKPAWFSGTMMIPAQYAMAPTQSQPNQMMQMMYNPYGMYHQQQIPTVQMISPMATTTLTPASTSTTTPTILSRSSPETVPAIESATISEIVNTPQAPQSPSSVTITELQKEIRAPTPKDQEMADSSEQQIIRHTEPPVEPTAESLHQVSDDGPQRQQTDLPKAEVPHVEKHKPEQILPEMEPPSSSDEADDNEDDDNCLEAEKSIPEQPNYREKLSRYAFFLNWCIRKFLDLIVDCEIFT